MGCRFAQRQNSHLRKCPWSTAAARSSEDPFVLRRIGKIQNEPIYGHQAQAAVERSWGVGFRKQPYDCSHQGTKRCQADPFSCLTQCRSAGSPLLSKPLHPAENLAIAVAAEQPQSNHEPHHEPSGKTTTETLRFAAPLQDGFHIGPRDDTLQSTDSLQRWPRRELTDFLVDRNHRSLLAGKDL